MQMQTALKNDDIRALYERFVVKDAEYFQRFRDIRGHFCANELAVYETLDPPRMVSLVDFKDWIAAYDLDRGKRLLLTSREDYEIRYLDYEETTLAEYLRHTICTCLIFHGGTMILCC